MLVTAVHLKMNNKDLEAIESLIQKHGDDIAVSIARSFERLDEKLTAVEERINMRLSGIENGIISINE